MFLRFDGGDAICRVQRISVASFGMPGEGVKVKVKAANTGFSNGRDVKLELLIAGQKEEVDSVTYPVWLAGEEKEVECEYTVPKDADLAQEPILFYYQINENGERRYRSETSSLSSAPRLSIDLAHADPEKLITDDNDTTCYHVTAIGLKALAARSRRELQKNSGNQRR